MLSFYIMNNICIFGELVLIHHFKFNGGTRILDMVSYCIV